MHMHDCTYSHVIHIFYILILILIHTLLMYILIAAKAVQMRYDVLASQVLYYTYADTYIHTIVLSYIHSCIHIHTYMHSYTYLCMHACLHTYIHTYIHTHTYAYMHIFIHTLIHTYLHTCKPRLTMWGRSQA